MRITGGDDCLRSLALAFGYYSFYFFDFFGFVSVINNAIKWVYAITPTRFSNNASCTIYQFTIAFIGGAFPNRYC